MIEVVLHESSSSVMIGRSHDESGGVVADQMNLPSGATEWDVVTRLADEVRHLQASLRRQIVLFFALYFLFELLNGAAVSGVRIFGVEIANANVLLLVIPPVMGLVITDEISITNRASLLRDTMETLGRESLDVIENVVNLIMPHDSTRNPAGYPMIWSLSSPTKGGRRLFWVSSKPGVLVRIIEGAVKGVMSVILPLLQVGLLLRLIWTVGFGSLSSSVSASLTIAIGAIAVGISLAPFFGDPSGSGREIVIKKAVPPDVSGGDIE